MSANDYVKRIEACFDVQIDLEGEQDPITDLVAEFDDETDLLGEFDPQYELEAGV
jgi:hypothetical protein